MGEGSKPETEVETSKETIQARKGKLTRRQQKILVHENRRKPYLCWITRGRFDDSKGGG